MYIFDFLAASLSFLQLGSFSPPTPSVPIPQDTPIRTSLSTFTLLPALSSAHFQQSNLISQHDVYMLVEASTLNRLNIFHILQDGQSHGHAVKSSRWLHKWKMAEVRCFQQPKCVL